MTGGWPTDPGEGPGGRAGVTMGLTTMTNEQVRSLLDEIDRLQAEVERLRAACLREERGRDALEAAVDRHVEANVFSVNVAFEDRLEWKTTATGADRYGSSIEAEAAYRREAFPGLPAAAGCDRAGGG
jgi:hypothetical protein